MEDNQNQVDFASGGRSPRGQSSGWICTKKPLLSKRFEVLYATGEPETSKSPGAVGLIAFRSEVPDAYHSISIIPRTKIGVKPFENICSLYLYKI